MVVNNMIFIIIKYTIQNNSYHNYIKYCHVFMEMLTESYLLEIYNYTKMLFVQIERGRESVAISASYFLYLVLGIITLNIPVLFDEHHILSPFEKSIIERTVQYIKDRTENFDDYFPCKKKRCKLFHIKKIRLNYLFICITRR